MHPFVIPIVGKSSVPSNYERDIKLGYFLVFMTYLVVGIVGCFGFMGVSFTD